MTETLTNPVLTLLRLIPGVETLSDGMQVLLSGFLAGVILFAFIAVFALYAVYLERKVAGHVQDRLGPMEVGWHGLLQTIADAIKLLNKEDFAPKDVDTKLFTLAPFLVFMTALSVFVVFPYDSQVSIANLNIGIFYVIAISSIAVPAVIMAGWSSNNKWSLFGAMRSAAQIVSYEIPVGLSIICVIMVVGHMGMQEIVEFQGGGFWKWVIFRSFPFNFIAFFIFFLGSLAEVNRTPFDLPEAESELVAGFMTEYSGMRWAFFFLAEYGNMLAVGLVGAALFLGGWQPPFEFLSFVPGWLWFILKALVLIFVQIWLRWTLPRLRVDQLMYVCWKVLVPFAFVCIIGVGLWEVLT